MDGTHGRGLQVCFALVLLAVSGCGAARLTTTPTPTPARTSAPATPMSTPTISPGVVSVAPRCGQYDDYQSASMAFYALSVFVDRLLEADPGNRELRAETMARFELTVRRVQGGQPVVAEDAVEELALFWVASDGCMR